MSVEIPEKSLRVIFHKYHDTVLTVSEAGLGCDAPCQAGYDENRTDATGGRSYIPPEVLQQPPAKTLSAPI